MNTKNIVSRVTRTAVVVGGAVAAQELGKMVTAETLDPLYTNIGKVVIGGLVIPMVAKGKAAGLINAFGDGFATEGGLALVNKFAGLTATPAIAGVDNADYALLGLRGKDNADYALMGMRGYGSQPNIPGSVANYGM